MRPAAGILRQTQRLTGGTSGDARMNGGSLPIRGAKLRTERRPMNHLLLIGPVLHPLAC